MEVLMNRQFLGPFLKTLCIATFCLGIHFVSADEEVPFPEVVPIDLGNNSAENAEDSLIWQESIGKDDSTYLQRIHNDAYYHLVAYSAAGDVVQLHDGSKWDVQHSGRAKVLYWVQSHNIFIKPNLSCFSSYKYVLQNRDRNETVEVNLREPPLPMGAYTFHIINIQPYARLIELSDKTIWQIDPKDSNFSHWLIGHRVIIGVNNNWRTGPLPNVIINVDMYNEPYSQGNFYGYPVYY
jgi:hypothetical protein